MKTLAALATLLALLQDPAGLVAGDPQSDGWPVSGRCTLGDEEPVDGSARRLERRWDARTTRFLQHPSDQRVIKTCAEASKKSFKLIFRPGTPGLYRVVAWTEDTTHGDQVLLLGQAVKTLAAGREMLPRLEKLATQLEETLEQLKDLGSGQVAPTDKAYDAFQSFIGKANTLLDEVVEKTDFTGTAAMARVVLRDIRDAQVWTNKASKNPMAQNDAHVNNKKGFFVDPNLTFEQVARTLKGLRAAASLETRVTICNLLGAQISRGLDGKALLELKAAAKEAKAFHEAAPEPSKDFAEVLEDLADGGDPAKAKEAFDGVLRQWVM